MRDNLIDGCAMCGFAFNPIAKLKKVEGLKSLI